MLSTEEAGTSPSVVGNVRVHVHIRAYIHTFSADHSPPTRSLFVMDLIIALSSSNHDSKPFSILCINSSIFTGIPDLLKYLFFSFILVNFPGRSIGPWSNEKAICCYLNNIKVLKSNRSVLRSVMNKLYVSKSKFVSVPVCLPPFPRFLSYLIYKIFTAQI